MAEIAPIASVARGTAAGLAAPSTAASGDRAAAGPGLPQPPPGPSAAPPPAGAPPAVEIARQGLLLEALAWRRGTPDATSPAALRGEVRVVPLLPGSPHGLAAAVPPPTPWLEGERLFTVLGPAGPDSLLAEAEDLAILLRGARLHLPAGARLAVTWERPPSPSERPAEPPAGPPAARPASTSGNLAPIGAASVATRDEPGPASEPRGMPAAPETVPLVPRPAAGDAGSGPIGEGIRRLAGLVGLAIEPIEDEDGRRDGDRHSGEDATPEAGRSRFAVELPELGRVRLALAWSRRGVELAIHGLPPLSGEERAALLRAFEAALEAVGARGRAVLLGDRAAGAARDGAHA